MQHDNTDLTLQTIAKIVSEGKCILFLGAAVHCPPNGEITEKRPEFVYAKNERPPLGAEFSTLLAQKTGFEERFPYEGINNLQRVSQDFEVQRSRRELVEEIKNAVFEGKKPSLLLGMLARLNFPIVITTNYDTLFEDALREAGKRPFVSIYKKNEERIEDYPSFDVPPLAPFVFKIHGDINQGESIVITEEDYIDFVLRMSDKQPFHPVPLTIQFYLQKWTTLFIGYSLRDYNLRLLFKTLRWKVDRANYPLAYSVDLKPDPLVFNVYHHQHKYITFLAQDVWRFVPELFERVNQQNK